MLTVINSEKFLNQDLDVPNWSVYYVQRVSAQMFQKSQELNPEKPQNKSQL